ncbi:MAG: signal peptidase II [Saprospiraceae bacterium]|nr:signal peptidase II [Saprospiraceae bacterium]
MLRTRIYRFAILLSVILINAGCDQLSKAIVRDNIPAYDRQHFADGHLMLTKVENAGAFLSMGDQLPEAAKNILLLGLPLFLLLGSVWLLIKPHGLSRVGMISLCCVIGGGLGNLIDRFLYGSVTDFLFLQFGLLKTGIFNLADVSITAGAICIVGDQIWRTYKQG